MPKESRKAPIKIVLVGGAGRMGREIHGLAQGRSGARIVASVEKDADWQKLPADQVDAVIDFSSPAGFTQALEWCLANEKPLVSGTTGLGKADMIKLKKASAKIPLLYSANMSLGIAVLLAMLNSFRALADWDFQVEEAHHSKKKDRPSGTALLLQEKLASVLGRQLPLPNSIRGGKIPGVHQIWAMGSDESLFLQHTAFDRKVFARGALQAGRWLIDKKEPGLYDLTDLYKKT